MNQRIEKYKFSQAFRDGSKAFIAFSSWDIEMYTLRQQFAACQPSLNRAMLLSAVKEDDGTWQSCQTG